jgi:hypothetical protein
MPRALITLLTDFGNRDEYVGCLKGVILSLNPDAALVDLSHEIPAQDIRTGAFVLAAAASYFPPGVIHLAVVDPGVGTARRGLAAHCRGQFWVGPDNGLFHLAWGSDPEPQIVSLENPAYFRPRASPTFHGRDIFAPVAAHLSLGGSLTELGPPITDPIPLPFPAPRFTAELAQGEVIHVDRFGNLVTNIPGEVLKEWLAGGGLRLQAGPLILTALARTYADAAPGEFLALIGSHGFLEIACRQDHAARRLGAGLGLGVKIYRII